MPIFFGENLESPLTKAAKKFLQEQIDGIEPVFWRIKPVVEEAKKLCDPDRLYVWLCCVSFLWHAEHGNGTGKAQTLLAQVLGEIPLLPHAERPALYNHCVAIFDFDMDDSETALAILERDDNIPNIFDYGCSENRIRWNVGIRCFFRADYEQMLKAMALCDDEEAYNDLVNLLALRREIGYAVRLAAQFHGRQRHMMLPYETLLETLKQHNTPETVEAAITQLEALGVKVNRDYDKRWSTSNSPWP
nr:hypothetical protein [Armatimonas sp.]